MRALVLGLTLALALPAHAKESAPPPDPGAHDKLIGIVTADVGVGLLVGGVGMLIGGAVVDDLPTRRGLNLGGGLCVAAGGVAMLVGTVVWFLGRKQTSDAKAGKVSLLPTGLAYRF